MKRIVQPIRKVYGTTTVQPQQQQTQPQHHQQQQQQTTMQMNAVRKINSLLQSGAVSVTGISGTQPRMIAKKPLNSQQTSVSITTTNSYVNKQQKCYVCGEAAGINATLLTEASTVTSQTEFTQKIAKIVGEGYMVIIGTDDVVCRRCITLFNQMDKLESDLEHVRNTLTGYIHRKYNILEDDGSAGGGDASLAPPPAKLQKLSSGLPNTTISSYTIKTLNDSGDSGQATLLDGSENQVVTLYTDKQMLPQQQQIIQQQQSQPQLQIQQQQQQILQTTNNGANIVQQQQQTGTPITTTIRRNPIKMYKCMSCDFKTQDLTQFQPHYEQCKANTSQQQSLAGTTATTTAPPQTSSAYRCKLCKKIFASVPLLKQHNAQEHQQHQQQTTTEMKVHEQNQLHQHQQQTVIGGGATITQLYACNMCAYKTPDKQNYDDHLRKHIKLKPFKCRVCLCRFETREQASIHAKSHQPDYFRCGICNVTFNKRELLMKHLETHESQKKQPQQQQAVTTTITTTTTAAQQQQQKQQIVHQQQQPQVSIKTVVPVSSSGNPGGVDSSSTQKLLQATIDEALRDTISETIDAKSIQFHSCNTCSLTFLNEKLYSQHMKMHGSSVGGPVTVTTVQTGGAPGAAGSKKLLMAATLNNQSEEDQQQQQLHGVGPGKQLLTSVSNASNVPGTTTASNAISDGDLESIFEKIHSDNKGDHHNHQQQVNSAAGGNITYSITLAQGPPQQQQTPQDGTTTFVQQQQQQGSDSADSKMQQSSVCIDMPTLDQGDDQQQQQQTVVVKQEGGAAAGSNSSIPVSMPSLDDDGEQSQNSHHSSNHAHAAAAAAGGGGGGTAGSAGGGAQENTSMELEAMQDGGDGGGGQQIKFILNENGQILQLDNHILTTDADGNQILVQGTDSEQIQQLLQSVGVVMTQGGEGLVGGEGETATLQMIAAGDGQPTGQMILVQGADGQEQLIDASLLNADGNIVIQQSQEGELNAEGTHITTEDGLQIPVSVAFASGEVQVDQEGGHHLTVAMGEGGEQQQIQLHLQQQQQQQDGESDHHHHHQQQQHIEGTATIVDGQQAILTDGGHIILHQQQPQEAGGDENPHETMENGAQNATSMESSTTAASAADTKSAASATGGGSGQDEQGMFNFDELIQPQVVVKQQVRRA